MSSLKRSVMTLYSDHSLESHRVRIVLAEKGVTVDILNIDEENPPEDFLDINPYHSLPTLIDRDLVLYTPNIIMEYLDERFPHPPLLPVYPVARAKSRLMMHRIEQDWYPLVKTILGEERGKVTAARKELEESLTKLAPAFGDAPYFLSDEFTMLDCCIIPLLWRLPSLNIHLSQRGQPVLDYAKRMFARESFHLSMTDWEMELRPKE